MLESISLYFVGINQLHVTSCAILLNVVWVGWSLTINWGLKHFQWFHCCCIKTKMRYFLGHHVC